MSNVESKFSGKKLQLPGEQFLYPLPKGVEECYNQSKVHITDGNRHIRYDKVNKFFISIKTSSI